MTAANIDENNLRETLRAHARALVAGPPDDVIARLSDFLDDHLANELTAHEVWEFLRSADYGPTDWSRDESIHARIRAETDRYRRGIADDRAPLAEIGRFAANLIAGLLAAPDGPAVVTVAADAGAGKTALIGQVLDDLQARAASDPVSDCPQVVLATRLDRLEGFRDAHELGAAMRLPGSPAAVLSRVAAGRPALLVLDQVDAFGAGSGRSPARLEAVAEVLREARSLGIKVLMACRVFDLEVDDRLAALAGTTRTGQPADGHHVERLEPLPETDVEEALRGAGIEPVSLTGSLRRLLSNPLHLHILIVLHKRGQLDPAGISTRLQLFDRFYAAVREEAEARQPNAPVTEVSDQLAAMLSERQELSVAAARLGSRQTTVENLARAGWLRRDNGRIAFAHEAFFDYAFAQRHMRSSQSMLSLLRSSEQHLFRRAQVRQILALEREQDRDQYLRDLREILAAVDVRPHLKELVIALVTLVPDPGLDEWQALNVLGSVKSDSLAERAHALAARAPGFSQLLLDHGIIAGYLADPSTADLGTWMCILLVQEHPGQVAELLLPYVGQEGWDRRLVRVLNAAPLNRSEEAASLMIAVIDTGGIDTTVRGPGTASSGDFFSLLHGIGSQSAASGASMVAAWLRRRLTLLEADGAYNPVSAAAGTEDTESAEDGRSAEGAGTAGEPGSPNTGDLADQERLRLFIEAIHAAQSRRLIGDSMSAPEILATIAAENPVTFARHILPVVRSASAASRTGKLDNNGETDEALGAPPSGRPERDPTDELLVRLAEAVRNAARNGDTDIHDAVREMAGSDLATEQFLAAAGFASGHPELLNDAAAWLQDEAYSLHQGYREDPLGLSAQIIALVCSELPIEATQGIQGRAATVTSDFEKHSGSLYGATAARLLRDIADADLTDETRTRRRELQRKFPPPAVPAPAPQSARPGGEVPDLSVQSPIDIAAVERMSDDNLVSAMRRWAADGWQMEPDGRFRGGATVFAQVISSAAQRNPGRFTVILESLPDDINPVYTTHILLGLRQVATPEQSLRAAAAARGHIVTSGTWIGHLIERAAPHLDAALLADAGLTENDVLHLIEELLAQPSAPDEPADETTPGPACIEPTSDTDAGNVQVAATSAITGQGTPERLMFRAWNRPEYAALRALAILAPRFPRAAEMLTGQLQHLAGSPELPLRALVIELCLTQFTAGPTMVTALITTALDSPDVVTDTGPEPLPADPRILLASHQLRDLLLRLRCARYDLVAPILTRMINFYETTISDDAAGLTADADQAAYNASLIAAIAACKNPDALALTGQLSEQQQPFRRGITAAFRQILPLGEMPDELLAILIHLFDDPDDDIARLAGMVIAHLPAGYDHLANRVLSSASQARTFALAPAPVITAAANYQGDISGSVLEMAERFFQLHEPQASDLRGNGAHKASVLGRLVIAIYAEVTQDPELSARALNLIDAMVLARAYGLEALLAKLDR